MADYFYMYGDDGTQDVNEAQRDIVAAFDLLAEEMRNYMRRQETALGISETDEFQALSQRTSERIHASINRAFGTSKEFEPRDLEAEKQRARDENIAKLGAYDKRLQKLIQLRSMFAETDPESAITAWVGSWPVHHAYRIFKLQVMRCATDISDVSSPDVPDQLAKLCVYRNALLSCNRIDEGWDEEEIFPFADVEF